MIQRHTILINLAFSANTGTTVVVDSSNLTTFGGYQINNVQGLGGGITNPSNVRGFLNDDNNDIIINSFFSYLTGSTTTSQFSEIYHSDQKLSDIFNDYYISVVLNNLPAGTSVINSSLTGTSATTILNNTIYNYDGVAPTKGLSGITMSIDNSTKTNQPYSAITTFTLEESYYIPVFVKRNHRQISRLKFDICDNIVNLLLNPPAPIAPNLLATPGDSKVLLNWSVITNATTYKIYISTTQGGPYTFYYGVNGNIQNKPVTGLVNGTTYYFVVVAINSSGESENSNEVYSAPSL